MCVSGSTLNVVVTRAVPAPLKVTSSDRRTRPLPASIQNRPDAGRSESRSPRMSVGRTCSSYFTIHTSGPALSSCFSRLKSKRGCSDGRRNSSVCTGVLTVRVHTSDVVAGAFERDRFGSGEEGARGLTEELREPLVAVADRCAADFEHVAERLPLGDAADADQQQVGAQVPLSAAPEHARGNTGGHVLDVVLLGHDIREGLRESRDVLAGAADDRRHERRLRRPRGQARFGADLETPEVVVTGEARDSPRELAAPCVVRDRVLLAHLDRHRHSKALIVPVGGDEPRHHRARREHELRFVDSARVGVDPEPARRCQVQVFIRRDAANERRRR